MESPERFMRPRGVPRPDLRDPKIKTEIQRTDKLPRKGIDFRGLKTQPQQ
ncbi:MAG TPA: hypothetical protein VFA93_02855 [Patescibacteria group bacterium]|nr:hypothetical protein [Patescibacteria group bacterium]